MYDERDAPATHFWYQRVSRRRQAFSCKRLKPTAAKKKHGAIYMVVKVECECKAHQGYCQEHSNIHCGQSRVSKQSASRLLPGACAAATNTKRIRNPNPKLPSEYAIINARTPWECLYPHIHSNANTMYELVSNAIDIARSSHK